MALIKCAECGKEISDRAAACPHCGAPLPSRAKANNSTTPVLGLIATGLGVASVLAPYFGAVFFVPAALLCGMIAYRQGQKGWGTAGALFGLLGLASVLYVSQKISGITQSVTRFTNDQERVATARLQVESFAAAAQRFNIEHGNFPTQEQGLRALRPYLTREIPLDPWNNSYVYRYPGERGGEPDILSFGADGMPGGGGFNQDIGSWE